MGDAFIYYSTKPKTKEFASQLYYRLFNDMEDTGSVSEDQNSEDSEYNLKHELNNYIQNIQNLKNLFKTNSLFKDFLYLDKRHNV